MSLSFVLMIFWSWMTVSSAVPLSDALLKLQCFFFKQDSNTEGYKSFMISLNIWSEMEVLLVSYFLLVCSRLTLFLQTWDVFSCFLFECSHTLICIEPWWKHPYELCHFTACFSLFTYFIKLLYCWFWWCILLMHFVLVIHDLPLFNCNLQDFGGSRYKALYQSWKH